MPVVTLTISDNDYQKLREKAQQAGYSTVSEYLMDIIEKGLEIERVKPQQTIEQPVQVVDVNEIRREISSTVRKIHDVINPYTSKIDELSRKVSELIERIEKIESQLYSISPKVPREREISRRRTALDYLKVDGYVFQKDLSWLKKPEAFFAKLKKEGAYVFESTEGYVAIDREFYQRLVNQLEKMKSPDTNELLNKVSPRARKLVQLMLNEGLIIYDTNSKQWRVEIQLI